MVEWTYLRIVRWMYDAWILYNAVTYDSFVPMIEAIGQFGRRLKLLSYHQVRFFYSRKKLNTCKTQWKDIKKIKQSMNVQLCVMSGRTWYRGLCLFFWSIVPRKQHLSISVDAFSYSKIGEKLLELRDMYVKKISV